MKWNKWVLAIALLFILTVGGAVADVSTIYINTNADGGVRRNLTAGNGEPWETIKAGEGNVETLSSTGAFAISRITTDSGSPNYASLWRFGMSGDTSSIPDDAIIDQAIVSIYGRGSCANTYGGSPYVAIAGFTPADPANLDMTDFDTLGNWIPSNNITYDTWCAADARQNFTLTDTTAISKTGYTSIMMVLNFDLNNEPLDWPGAAKTVYVQAWESSASGTASDPFVEITWHLPNPPITNFSATPLSGEAPLIVQFTDESTNAPISWSWDFGDGNSSTTQSPSHIYAFPGSFNVTLAATNADGTGNSNSTTQITVGNPAIVPDFQANVTGGTAPLPAVFTDLSTGSVNGWAWDFGDGNTSDQQNPEYTFLECSRKYNVTLEISDTFHSNSTTKTDYITTDDCPLPTLEGDWTFEPVFNFNGTNTTPATSWNWSFPDGGYSDDQNTTHKLFWGVQNFVSLKITNNTMSIFSNKTIDLSAGNGTSTGGARPQVIQQHLIVI